MVKKCLQILYILVYTVTQKQIKISNKKFGDLCSRMMTAIESKKKLKKEIQIKKKIAIPTV